MATQLVSTVKSNRVATGSSGDDFGIRRWATENESPAKTPGRSTATISSVFTAKTTQRQHRVDDDDDDGIGDSDDFFNFKRSNRKK